MPSGGQLIVQCLEAQGVDRVFLTPGESYLEALDALYDSPIETIVARQEGGAAIMAEADGKLTGRPGVAFVTRGPGATNAAAGVHIAKQDATPMILFVGQIGRAMRGRDAFQEVDYRQTFRDLAKHVDEIDRAERIPEILSRAFHLAMNGRPGPVVLALPEDMLRDETTAAPGPRVERVETAPSAEAAEAVLDRLDRAERPVMLLGGPSWTERAVAAAADFAAIRALPTAVTFRRQNLMSSEHPAYAGDLGLGPNPALVERIRDADLVLAVGAKLSENPSQSFTLFDIPSPRQALIHVLASPDELGRIYAPALGLAATPTAFFAALDRAAAGRGLPRRFDDAAVAAHAAYEAWSTPRPCSPTTGSVDLSAFLAALLRLAPEATLCNGAGNYAIWAHRYWKYRRFGQQLAPTSGSMGYGLPAAIAAKLRAPEREVIALAGDGCFQMTGQEFGSAIQFGAGVIVIVVDNGSYGTIRMHQERRFPGRVSGTDLVNPDFAALARAYGGHGETVRAIEDFAPALHRCREAGRAALIHVLADPERLTPSATIAELRGAP